MADWEMVEIFADGTRRVTLGRGPRPAIEAPMVVTVRLLRPLPVSAFKAMVAALHELPE